MGNNITYDIERFTAERMINRFVDNCRTREERDRFYKRVLDIAEVIFGKGKNNEKLAVVRQELNDPDSKWLHFIDGIFNEIDPLYMKKLLLTAGYGAFIHGTRKIRENRELHHCNIPWLILFDPTSACNMHCKGCWSGTYGPKNNLSYEDMDRIVTQGKELGVYIYMMTGGEPLVRKNDIL